MLHIEIRKYSMSMLKNEQGNAVALTLLGLSAAILAGVVVLYYLGKKTPEPVYVTPKAAEEEVKEQDKTEGEQGLQEGWNTYVNNTYGFTMEYPDGWMVATGTLRTGDPVITFTPATQITATSSPVYSHQDVANHVSVYPQGVATEGIASKSKPSEVVLPLSYATTLDYTLTSNRPWATKVSFSAFPTSWNESGFVFARAVVEEEKLTYMRGDTEIEQYEFDAMTGDLIARTGLIDVNIRNLEEEMLETFQFTNTEIEEQTTDVKHIILEEPLAGTVIVSPQTVKGTIPGGWYYGEEYPITLQTDEGEVLAELFATGFEEWDSEQSIPFEVSLVFENPTATSGVLTIGDDNEDGGKLVIPVQFDNK